MDELNLYVGIFTALAAILAGLLFFKSKSKSENNGEKPRRRQAIPLRDEDGQILNAAQPAGPRGRRGGPRMRRRPQQQAGEAAEDDGDGNVGGDDGDADDNNKVTALGAKVGKKKLEKLQAKADKKLEREAELRDREERKKRNERAEEERRLQEAKEAEEEQKRLEEEARAREEKERREHEEYLKMAEAFTVDEEGFDEDEDEGIDAENKLQAFLQYIKDTKVMLLEDLAAKFKLKTQDVIDRVTQLMEDGQLTGVIDDRGKLIFISQEELEAVAKFITQRGRISISELAENSNRLISLNSAVDS